MQIQQEAIDELVLEIHRCSLEPTNWSPMLSKLASCVAANQIHIFSPELSPASQLLFDDGRALPNPIACAAREGTVYCSGEVLLELGRAAVVIVIDEQSPQIAPATALTLFREDGQECFDQQTVRLLKHLVPHLRLAVESFWKWQRRREAEHARELALDSLATAVFGIDAHGEVIFANAKGEAELKSGTWLARDGRVLKASSRVVEHHKFNSRLQQLVRDHGFAMQLHCSKTRSTATVCGAFHTANRARHGSGPMGLIWIIDSGADPVGLSLAIEIFKLSRAEAKLLRHLRDGLPLKEAALVLGVKESTARAQLQSIFTKTGRRRQSELIALLERLALLRSD